MVDAAKNSPPQRLADVLSWALFFTGTHGQKKNRRAAAQMGCQKRIILVDLSPAEDFDELETPDEDFAAR